MKHSTFIRKLEEGLNTIKELSEKHCYGLDAYIYDDHLGDFGFEKNIYYVAYEAKWLKTYGYSCSYSPKFNAVYDELDDVIRVEFGRKRMYRCEFKPNDPSYPIKCMRYTLEVNGMYYCFDWENEREIKVESFIKALNRFIEKLKFWTTCNGYKWHMKEKEEYPLF